MKTGSRLRLLVIVGIKRMRRKLMRLRRSSKKQKRLLKKVTMRLLSEMSRKLRTRPSLILRVLMKMRLLSTN